MTAFLITSLFITTGALALSSILRSLHRYGGAAMQLRGELRDCPEWREVRVTSRTVVVQPASAVILRPAFRGRGRYPAAARVLPAAA